MTKLEQLINELCPNGVEHVTLGSVCEIGKGVQFNKVDMNDEGTYPVINGGINPSGYIEQYNQSENTITISQGGASAGYVNWLTVKFWAGAHCYIVKPSDKLLNRYAYHFIKSQEYKLQECQYGAGIPALAKSTVSDLLIPVPPIEVQREIVRILDNFTELTAREKQYKYYRDTLLERNMPTEKVPLGSICEVYDGTHQTPEYTESGIPFVSVEDIDNLSATKKFISPEAYAKYKVKPRTGDVFMTRITAGVIGKCAIVENDDDLAYYVSLALLRPNRNVLDSRYLKHYLESGIGKIELAKRILWDATPTKINKDDIGKLFIAVPPLDVQERLVRVLDNFDTICTDLNIGLPAEIEARHKQYEYYRDKLLSFKNIEG